MNDDEWSTVIVSGIYYYNCNSTMVGQTTFQLEWIQFVFAICPIYGWTPLNMLSDNLVEFPSEFCWIAYDLIPSPAVHFI